MPAPPRSDEAEMAQLQQDLAKSTLDNSAKQAYISVLVEYIRQMEEYAVKTFGDQALDNFPLYQKPGVPS